MEKIIALEIDEYRVGITAANYDEVLSATYSSVKKDNWKAMLFKKKTAGHGIEIQLEGANEPIYWGVNHLSSRRVEAYTTFGNVLANLAGLEAQGLVKTILSYLVQKVPAVFEKITDTTLACSLSIGVATESTEDLTGISQSFCGEFQTVVEGQTYTILVKEAVIIPRTLGAVLAYTEAAGTSRELEGLAYVLDLSDHYLCCDVYEEGELIQHTDISGGLIDLADRVVQEYKTSCLRNATRPFQINSEMVYNLLTNTVAGAAFQLTVNGQNTIDLTELIQAEFVEETKKVLSYFNKDQNVQYADYILIRDIETEMIKADSINNYLESVGLCCTKLRNTSARGEAYFGELFWHNEPDDVEKANLKTQNDPIQQQVPAPMPAMENEVDKAVPMVEETSQINQDLQEIIKEQADLLNNLTSESPIF